MSDTILSANDALLIPVIDGKKPIVLDMREIRRAQARLIELRSVTKLKAGELIYTFIDAWSRAATYAVQLKAEVQRAKARMREARAVVVLDKVPEELKRRGLASARSPAGSEDLRTSVVDRDRDFQAAEDLVIQLTAEHALMETRAEQFKMAYFSVDRDNGPNRRDTSGGAGEDDLGAPTAQEKIERFVNEHSAVNPVSYASTGFGAPKL